jgi:hypothetical protein
MSALDQPLPVSERLTSESAHAHQWLYPDESGDRRSRRRVCRLCALYQEENTERGTWVGYSRETPAQMVSWGYWESD